MRLKLTRIGNSRGIRIPKPLIVQCGLGDVVDLRVVPEGLVITPHRLPRHGWREAFAQKQDPGSGLLLGDLPANTFDRREWKW
jgi:antitoxin MazE